MSAIRSGTRITRRGGGGRPERSPGPWVFAPCPAASRLERLDAHEVSPCCSNGLRRPCPEPPVANRLTQFFASDPFAHGFGLPSCRGPCQSTQSLSVFLSQASAFADA